MKGFFWHAAFAAILAALQLCSNGGRAQAAPGNAYVAAGHYIQEFSGTTGAFIGNVTTTNGIQGASNTELHFGPGNDLYGIGSNGWVYQYDFSSGHLSTFFKPTGDGGTSGLALGPDSNWYVAAGHYIQEFSGTTGAFIGNVTTTNGIQGASNTELNFGPGNDLYGIGSNGWVYQYDFSSGHLSTFFKPTGDGGTSGLALGPDSNWYVAAGHYIQEFSGTTGAFIGNVTTTNGIQGASNTELNFGPGNDLYGIGSNGWVYQYDFSSGHLSTFFKPTGDGGTSGLAFSTVPEPSTIALALIGSLTLLALKASLTKRSLRANASA